MTTVALRPSHSFSHPATAGEGGPAAAMSARPAKIALVGAIAAVPPITLLHLNADGVAEPGGWTISDYVVTLPYGVPLFGMTAAALAIGAAALARGLAQQTRSQLLPTLLVVWATAVVTLAVFPTNPRGTPPNLSSNVHLIAGAVVFAVLPLAAWLLARRERRQVGRSVMSTVLAAVAATSGALSAALIVNRLPGAVGMPELTAARNSAADSRGRPNRGAGGGRDVRAAGESQPGRCLVTRIGRPNSIGRPISDLAP